VRIAAEEEIRQMEALIGTTLDFVDNENRPRLKEPLDLGLLVEGLVDDFADMGRDVTLTGAEPVIIAGDMILLKRLFTNLIDNAIKYGDRARVRVMRKEGRAIVTIEDDGPGMEQADIARAFEPFYRGEPSRNRSSQSVPAAWVWACRSSSRRRRRIRGGCCWRTFPMAGCARRLSCRFRAFSNQVESPDDSENRKPKT